MQSSTSKESNLDLLNSQLNEIDRQLKELENFNSTEKQKSYYAKYLTVFICGIYEAVIENMLVEWTTQIHSPEITTYIRSTLNNYFSNPDFPKLMEFLSKFSREWCDEVDKLPPVCKDGLNSIISNKNSLAHTGDITITMDQIKNYYTSSRKVLEKLAEILDNSQICRFCQLHNEKN